MGIQHLKRVKLNSYLRSGEGDTVALCRFVSRLAVKNAVGWEWAQHQEVEL